MLVEGLCTYVGVVSKYTHQSRENVGIATTPSNNKQHTKTKSNSICRRQENAKNFTEHNIYTPQPRDMIVNNKEKRGLFALFLSLFFD